MVKGAITYKIDLLGCLFGQNQPEIKPDIKFNKSDKLECSCCNEALRNINPYLQDYKKAQNKQRIFNTICIMKISCGSASGEKGGHRPLTSYLGKISIRTSEVFVKCDTCESVCSKRFHHEIIHAEDFCLKGRTLHCDDAIKREIDAYYFSACYGYKDPKQCLLDNVKNSVYAYPECKGENITIRAKDAIENFIKNPTRG